MRGSGFRVAVAAGLLSAACASGPPPKKGPVTWDRARPRSERATPAPHAAPPPARPRVISLDGEDERLPPVGVVIDGALVRFVAARSAVPRERGTIPPPALLVPWWKTVSALEQALDRAPEANDLGALVRARVTLEVELERDKERYPDLPHELVVSYMELLDKIDQRVRELHASNDVYGFDQHIPPPEGDLVLQWPLGYFTPTSPYGYREDPFNGRVRFHNGIDLSAQHGASVMAASPGVVVFAAWSGGYGNYVVLEHAFGVRTHYAHLNEVLVDTGTIVDQRSVIGTLGSTGRATGPHLHYAISVQGHYVDPALYTSVPIAPDGSIPDS